MTKSYNYIPTHFLYSSLLFFLLIFMHQQTYCHTLPKPFSKIFLLRIYAPTIHSTDIEFDETSDRLTHISAPIQHPQTNPPTTQSTKSPRPYDPQTNPPTTTDAQTKPQIPHTTNTKPYSLHTNTASTKTHAHSTQARPPTQTLTLTLTPMHRRCCSTDAVAATHRSAIRQARQTGSD